MFSDKRAALITEIEAAETRAGPPRMLLHRPRANSRRRIGTRARRLKPSGWRAKEGRAEERHDAAGRRLADVDHEIREMLEVEPAAVAALAELKPDAPLPETAAVEQTLERIGASGSGLARSTCAPRRNWVRWRPSTPR